MVKRGMCGGVCGERGCGNVVKGGMCDGGVW